MILLQCPVQVFAETLYDSTMRTAVFVYTHNFTVVYTTENPNFTPGAGGLRGPTLYLPRPPHAKL